VKITRKKLQRVIKEELSRALSEQVDPLNPGRLPTGKSVRKIEKKKGGMAKELQKYLRRKARSLTDTEGLTGRYAAHAEWALNPDGTDKGVVIHVDDSTSISKPHIDALTKSFKIDATQGFVKGKLDKNVLWAVQLAFSN